MRLATVVLDPPRPAAPVAAVAPRRVRAHAALAWVGLVLLALTAGIGLRDPSPPDEPRFVLAARTMVDTGEWALPHRGSELYGHKPATFMWLQAASYLLLRDWSIAFLLPSLLAALLTLALVHDLARRLWNRRVAWHAAGALFVTLQFGLQAKRAQIDMVLVALTTLALWALLRHLLLDRQRWLAWLGAAAAGLGTVTKGVGFLPLLVLLPWRALPMLRRGDGALHGGMMVAGFLAGAALWLVPMAIGVATSDDPAARAYVGEILLRQTGERYANPWHHLQPAWYYLQVMLTLWLPGVLLAPWLLPAWWRRLRRCDPRTTLLLGWAALVLLFFSLSPAKREVYLFPALPAVVLAAAPLLPGLLRRRAVRLLLLGYLFALGLLAVVLGLGGLADLQGLGSRLAAERALDADDSRLLFASLLGFGGAVLAIAGWARLRRVAAAVVATTALLWLVYGLGLAPALDASSSARALMTAVGARIGPQAELGLVAWREQQLLQADRPVAEFGFSAPWQRQWESAAAWLEAAPAQRWLLVDVAALSPCVDPADTVAIGRANRRDFRLLPGRAWPAGCVTPAFDPSSQQEHP